MKLFWVGEQKKKVWRGKCSTVNETIGEVKQNWVEFLHDTMR